jgi:hypothetical protein
VFQEATVTTAWSELGSWMNCSILKRLYAALFGFVVIMYVVNREFTIWAARDAILA